MPIETACPACHKKYRLPDSLAGRRAKCPACDTVMLIPTVGATTPTAAKPRAAAKSPAPPAVADPFGLGSLGGKEELFDSTGPLRPGVDPLGEPVVQDFGFAIPGVPIETEVIPTVTSLYSENPVVLEQRRLQEEHRKRWGSASNNPYMKEAEAALSATKSGKRKSKGTSITEDDDSHTNIDGITHVIAAVMTILGAIAIGAAIFSPGVGSVIAIILLIAGSLLANVGQIWALVLAFINSKDEIWKPILYLLCGPYQFVYWYQNWGVMKTPVYLSFSGFIGVVLGIVALMVATAKAAAVAS